MTENGNSVNITTKQKPYHYGNLRNVLISTGLEILVEKDADEFSLREVARTVGVSATSVYRHFTDKQAFVKALCSEGSQMLAMELHKAMSSSGGGQEGFDSSGLAYVRFATANPALFRLMNRRLPTQINISDPENPVMQEIMTNVAMLLPRNATHKQQLIRAYHAWSVAHGVTMLILEGHLPNDEEMIKSVLRNPGP